MRSAKLDARETAVKATEDVVAANNHYRQRYLPLRPVRQGRVALFSIKH